MTTQYLYQPPTVDSAFEARVESRHKAETKRLQGQMWACIECGESYGADWVAANGEVCNCDCNGDLEEVGA